MFKILSIFVLMFSTMVVAGPITGVATLPATTSLITFNDADISGAVTDQFSDQGATFTNLSYSSGFSPRANTDGGLLFRFGRNETVGIQFTSAVTRAVFAIGSNDGTGTFTSLLAGDVQETFTASISNTATLTSANVFGFENSLFDEITFNNSQASTGFSLDNLSFDVARVDAPQVPAPGTFALLGLGLAGLGWSRRKKS